jgi:hypothetical protein
MGEACTTCRFVCIRSSHLPYSFISFAHRFVSVRKKKRVSYPRRSTTESRISCVLKFSRDAMPNVRARHVSTPVANPVVFTRSCERLDMSFDHSPTPLVPFRFRKKTHLDPRAVGHSRSGRLVERRTLRSLLKRRDHKLIALLSLDLMPPFPLLLVSLHGRSPRSHHGYSGIPSRLTLGEPNTRFHPDCGAIPTLFQAREYRSSPLFVCPSFPVPSPLPCHFFRSISRLLEKRRETWRCRCMFPCSCFPFADQTKH